MIESEQEYLAALSASLNSSLPASSPAKVHDLGFDKPKMQQQPQQHQQQAQKSTPKKPRKQAKSERQQRDDTLHALLNIWTRPKADGAEESEVTASIKQLRARYELLSSQSSAAADVQHLKSIPSQWISKIFSELVLSRNCDLDDCAFHAHIRKSKAALSAADATGCHRRACLRGVGGSADGTR